MTGLGRNASAFRVLAVLAAIGTACGGRSTREFETGGGGTGGDDRETGGAGNVGTGATGGNGRGGTGVGGSSRAGSGGTSTGGLGGSSTGGTGVGGSGGEGGIEPRCDPEHVYVGSLTADSNDDLEVLRYYDVIEGDLTLEGEVTDLDALHCATNIAGSVRIHADGLESLAGLERLVSVGFDLRFDQLCDPGTEYCQQGRALTGLDALGNLKRVGGNLAILRTALTDLGGLEGLESVGVELRISGNYSLVSLEGLSSLGRVGGDLRLEGFCADESCREEAYTSVNGLRNLTSVGGLRVFQTSLENLDGFAALTAIANSLEISANPALKSIAGLRGVGEIPGELAVLGNASLTVLDGLENVVSVGGNLRITEYEDFSYDLELRNDSLENVDALALLTSFSGDLNLSWNRALTDLHGLAGIERVHDLSVHSNSTLPSCEAAWLLQSIGPENVSGRMLILHNDDTGVCVDGM